MDRRGWVVYVKAAGRGHAHDEPLAEFALALESHRGVAAGGEGKYSARFWLAHDGAGEYVPARAIEVFRKAASKAGLPAWPIVRVEIMTLAEWESDNAGHSNEPRPLEGE